MKHVAIEGQVRQEVGKKAVKANRREGLVPCVIYGLEENVHFTCTPKDLKGLVYTPEFKLAEITVDGKTHRCILKDIQFHPVSEDIVHVDFLKLNEGQKIRFNVPVGFEGVATGVKNGGKLIQNVRKVKVKTTPELMMDRVVVNVEHLTMGQSVRVKDIEVAEGVEILNSPGIPLATVEVPRALKSAATAEAKAEKEAAKAGEGADAEAGGDDAAEGGDE